MTKISQKQQDILCAAIEIFRENGFQPATMENIASRASVSKRTLYKYFPTKDELFDAIIELLLQRSNNPDAFIYSSDEIPKTQLRRYCREQVDIMCCPDHISLCRIVLGECISSEQQAKRLIHKVEEKEFDLVIWLEAAIEDGKLAINDSDVKTAAENLKSCLKAKVFWPQILGWQAPPDETQRDEIVEEAIGWFIEHHSVPGAETSD